MVKVVHIERPSWLFELFLVVTRTIAWFSRGSVWVSAHATKIISTSQLHSTKPELKLCAGFKSCSRRVGDSRWWGSLAMAPAGDKAKRLSSVNHTTKINHHHHHHQVYHVCPILPYVAKYLLYPKCDAT